MDATRFPPPPHRRGRPAAPARPRRRPAPRARLVAGALAVLAFLGIATGIAAGADDPGNADAATRDGAADEGVAGGSSESAPWPQALPGTPFQGQPPSTSTHAS